MEPPLRNAIARIDIMQGGKSLGRGTGFLVGPGLVLTALHVVADRAQTTLQVYPGQIHLAFPEHSTTARADPDLWDRSADWVLLTCDEPAPAAAPLPMADLRISGGSWSTFGFPDANPRDGMEQSGTVESHLAPFEAVIAYQLFSKQAAAGDGAPAKGLSGAPVIMQGAVVGLLRFALMKAGQTVAGTLYGCAIRDVINRCGARLPPPIDSIVVPEELSFRDQDRLRRACGIVRGDGIRASGYLIDRNRVITSARVAESVGVGGPIAIDWPGLDPAERTMATVARIDAAVNTAVLWAAAPAGAMPLALADCPNGRVLWQGYGFPVAVGDESLPISGVVREIGARPGSVLKLAFDRDSAGGLDDFDGLPGSPVMVDGRIVGQIKDKLIAPLAAATATRDVRKLLEAEDPPPSIPAAPPGAPGPPSPAPRGERSAGGDDDVVVSYASADTGWARQLADRLTALDLQVYMDMLPPAEASKPARDRALDRSIGGVIVLSRSLLDVLDSPVFRSGAADVLARRRVAIARVDVCDPPADWPPSTVIDFTDRPTPAGPRLVRIYAALTAGTGDAGAAIALSDTESRVTDHLLRDARAAARAARATGDPRRVLALHRQWQTAGVLDSAVVNLIAEALIQMNEPAQALTLLDEPGAGPTGVRGDQLRALALGKEGRVDESIAILTRLRDSGQLDAETGGLLGGRYKQKWLNTGDAQFLRLAKDVYLETFERTADSYPGINAAALTLQLGSRQEAAAIATRVVNGLESVPADDLDHWQQATLGEAHLLSGDLAQAARWYAGAVKAGAMAIENIATMRRQARLNLRALDRPADSLDDILMVPKVAAFTGHRVDADDRETPRFPARSVDTVRLAIRDRLAHRQTAYGFSSAADGSDLLFVEELLERGGRSRVFLPFPPDDFIKISVRPDWTDRFARVIEHPRVEVKVLAPVCPPPDQRAAAFRACNDALLLAARTFANGLDEVPVLLTVFAGTADGEGGTRDAIRAWEEKGLVVEVIDPSAL